MAAMDWSVAWRAALLQGLCVAAIAVVLALTLDKSFFEDWGWLAGPGVWAGCALVCAAVLHLRPLRVIVGAALAGLPSLAAVLAGVHWAGTPLALTLFGVWCGLAARTGSPTRRIAGRSVT